MRTVWTLPGSLAAAALCGGLTLMPAVASATRATSPGGTIQIFPFTRAPAYPYDGLVPGPTPDQAVPFLDGPEGARFHVSPRGGKMMAATTYSDPRSLLALPRRFDPETPGAAIVVFFHGNLATLQRDVEGRQGVPRQLFASRINAALVAPQLAVNALDSSPGHFYDPGFFDKYLDEAEAHLADMSNGRFGKDVLAKLPVVIVAYSGGYLATAFSLHDAPTTSRIRGVILLDALFGESAKIEDWIERTHVDTFFLSAYSKASASQNAALEAALAAHGVPIQSELPRVLAPGDVVFVAAPDAVHNDFVTRAWAADPLRAILACVRLAGGEPTAATCGGGAASKVKATADSPAAPASSPTVLPKRPIATPLRAARSRGHKSPHSQRM